MKNGTPSPEMGMKNATRDTDESSHPSHTGTAQISQQAAIISSVARENALHHWLR
jgi:hypothetical protein